MTQFLLERYRPISNAEGLSLTIQNTCVMLKKSLLKVLSHDNSVQTTNTWSAVNFLSITLNLANKSTVICWPFTANKEAFLVDLAIARVKTEVYMLAGIKKQAAPPSTKQLIA